MVERRLGIKATVEVIKMLDLSEDIEEEVFYIISEALNNSLKHAEATEVSLLISVEDGQTMIVIRDNGCGFDLKKGSSGLGLESMCLRAEKIGVLVTMDSAIGQGTTVQIFV